MKSSWTIIRDQLTKSSTPESTGFQMQLIAVADVFIILNSAGKFSDSSAACRDFNADRELCKALLNRGALERLKHL